MREVKLAEQIIQLDILRDELYEELLTTFGWRAQEFLRAVQNRQCLVTSKVGTQAVSMKESRDYV